MSMNENNDNLEPIGGTKGNNQLLLLGGGIAVIAALGVIFFAMKGSTPSNTAEVAGTETAEMAGETIDLPVEESGDAAGIVEEGVRQITIEAGSFYYKPNVITVKKGEKVQIVLSSKDMVHDFQIDELNVKGPMTKSGETSTVEFTADKVGTFEYYCSVGQHRKMGQVGTITVTE